MAEKPAGKPIEREAARKATASVFVSYSRQDAPLVQGLLGFYRAIDVRLFRDEDSIKPGQKWRIEIDAALEQCDVIMVFWCGHAAQSSEVRSEYERAISLDKRIVPVLIDHTALPVNLGQYQGIDLRATLSEHHTKWGPYFRVLWGFPFLLLFTLVSFIRLYWRRKVYTPRRPSDATQIDYDIDIARARRQLEASLESILS
jgi:hypothetical protein